MVPLLLFASLAVNTAVGFSNGTCTSTGDEDCGKFDCGSCGTNCCMLRFRVSTTPVETVNLMTAVVDTGGPDAQYTWLNSYDGVAGFRDERSLQKGIDFAGSLSHKTSDGRIQTLSIFIVQDRQGGSRIDVSSVEAAQLDLERAFEAKTTGTSFENGVWAVNKHSKYVQSVRQYQRPIRLSVELRQTSSSSQACGYVSVFPSENKRNSGYIAGVGGGGTHFFAGLAKPTKRAELDRSTHEWHKVDIDVSADGNVYFFLDGMLRHTENSQPFDSGVIRFGYNCQTYEYRNATVREASCDSGQNYKNILMLMKAVSWREAVEKVSIEPFCQGNTNLSFWA
eukprot:TRINITY_DN11168_c0_g2_i1.p1 TRINITY_DN11168_c0_g2~~TRINITY_DN11168_c0_g2_i1.p1  ORF type:complete len:338 (-),score=33.17 TRINITY_DN11168_c0_g2_i1:165-1178(-)